MADVRKADLNPIGPYLVSVIERELGSEGLPIDVLGPLDPDQVVIAKTASRSTLGYMKEIALHARHQIEDSGGLDHSDVTALNHRLQLVVPALARRLFFTRPREPRFGRRRHTGSIGGRSIAARPTSFGGSERAATTSSCPSRV